MAILIPNRCRLIVATDPPNIPVGVGEKAAEDVDCQNAQPALRLDVHYREHSLVEDRVAHVLGRVCVSGNLRAGERGGSQ